MMSDYFVGGGLYVAHWKTFVINLNIVSLDEGESGKFAQRFPCLPRQNYTL